MNLRKFWFLFGTTAVVGMALGLLAALSGLFHISVVFGLITGGFLSATSMMGFWAYLTLNFTMRNFVTFGMWLAIQVLLIVLVFFDMVYFRYLGFGGGEGSVWPYIGFATWPLAVALVGAFFKARVSGGRSFIPAVFFLYGFTVLEWFVALKSGAELQTNLIGLILIGCNLYLLFQYTRLLKQPSPKR
ncbi:MAG TPA: KinB-signaling pathway activation protein [Bacilli bacterium]|nr:KinB-signaling pathway activation protein [Bacilli bacterium]